MDLLPRARNGAERVPAHGPLILAPNHFSFMDHFFVGAFIRRRVSFMAKSQLFKPPMQWIYTHGGVFPVRRGFDDEEAFMTANAILARGGTIVMYVEGTRSRTGQLADPPTAGHRPPGARLGGAGSPSPSTDPRTCATGNACNSRQSPSTYGDLMRFGAVPGSTQEQQMGIAEQVFREIRSLYDRT